MQRRRADQAGPSSAQSIQTANAHGIKVFPFLFLFDFQHEKEFLNQLNSQRRHGLVDPTLFALSALFSLVSIPHVIAAGHSEDVPTCYLSAIIGSLGVYLHFRPASAWTLNLRIPLHLLVHMLNQVLALRSLTYRDRVICVGDRPFLELFAAFSLFQSLYPTGAAVPLVYAIPSQIFFTFRFLEGTLLMCDMGYQVCAGSGQFYSNLAIIFNLVSLTIPGPPGPLDQSILEKYPLRPCYAISAFICVVCFLMIFDIVAVRAESRMRGRYCAQKGAWEAMRYFEKGRLRFRHVLFWIGLATNLLWKAIDIVYLRKDYLSSYCEAAIASS